MTSKKVSIGIKVLLWVNFLIVFQSQSSWASGPEIQSLCNTQETNLFGCTIENSKKIISLCSSKISNDKNGYVRYRFGRPDKVELEFPKETRNTRHEFKYAHYSRYQVDRTEISFSVGKYKYVLYEYYDGEENTEKNERGILTILPSGEKRQLLCAKNIYGSLNNLKSIAICDSENPLNMDGCSTR